LKAGRFKQSGRAELSEYGMVVPDMREQHEMQAKIGRLSCLRSSEGECFNHQVNGLFGEKDESGKQYETSGSPILRSRGEQL
jgi:hypothetical protein